MWVKRKARSYVAGVRKKIKANNGFVSFGDIHIQELLEII